MLIYRRPLEIVLCSTQFRKGDTALRWVLLYFSCSAILAIQVQYKSTPITSLGVQVYQCQKERFMFRRYSALTMTLTSGITPRILVVHHFQRVAKRSRLFDKTLRLFCF